MLIRQVVEAYRKGWPASGPPTTITPWGNTNFVAVVEVVSLRPVGLFEVDACPWAVALDVARGQGYASSNQSAALTAFDLARVKRGLGR